MSKIQVLDGVELAVKGIANGKEDSVNVQRYKGSTITFRGSLQTAQLLDAYGKILCTLAVDANQTEFTVPVDNLSAGTYLIRLRTANGTRSGKFVKY